MAAAAGGAAGGNRTAPGAKPRWLCGRPEAGRPRDDREAMDNNDCIFNVLRILLIEDESATARRVRQALSQTPSLESSLAIVSSIAEAKPHLRERNIDLVLLGGATETTSLAEIRGAAPEVPVIALRGRNGEEPGECAGPDGVSDFLAKGELTPHRLERSICYVMAKHRASRTEILKEAALDIISASAPGAFCVVDDRSGRMVYFNTRFTRLLRLEKLVGPSDKEGPRAYDLFVQAGLPADKSLYTVRPPEALAKRTIALGTKRIVDLTIIAIPDYRGAHLGNFYRFEEIPKRQNPGQRESESERLFKQMADTAPMMVWLMGPKGRMKYCNRHWLEYTGQSPEDDLEESWMRRIHPEDRIRVREARREAIRHKRPCSLTYRMRCASGDYHWMLSSGSPRYTDTGGFAGYIGSCVDISEHRRKEMAMREVEKLAATARMAARIAHEINNPLAGIRNSFLLIQDAIPPSHPYYAYVGRIERELERITNVVRQMYELHNPESGDQGVCNVSQAIGDVTSLLQGNCLEQQVTIRTPGCPPNLEVPVIRTGTLRQILFNLVQNAIEASPPGGTIEITAQVSKDILTIEVNDEGPGIPEEQREKIYEPFFSTKTHLAHSGLGLGLATCKSLIEAMGGTLTSSDRPGGGTVFRVRLSRQLGESRGNSHEHGQPNSHSG